MTRDELIDATLKFVQHTLNDAEGGHDFSHTYRVWQNALKICQDISCNLLTVELAALLHDIADSKFNNGDESLGPKMAEEFLLSIELDSKTIKEVSMIIKQVGFKGGHNHITHSSIELQIVQDADRLEAIGAIGIARAFNYGGYKNRAIFDEKIMPNLKMSKESYKKSTAPTINHFYEKLPLLKDKFNTAKGKQMAASILLSVLLEKRLWLIMVCCARSFSSVPSSDRALSVEK